MGKNRSMQAKHDKAIRCAIVERKFREVCEIQTERVLSRVQVESVHDSRMRVYQEQAKQIADKAVKARYPGYVPEKVVFFHGGKRIPVSFSEGCKYRDEVMEKAINMLKMGFSVWTTEMFLTV